MHPSFTSSVPVTDSNIAALGAEALLAGDYQQAGLCARALGEDTDDLAGLSEDESATLAAMSRHEARAECERVIRSAE